MAINGSKDSINKKDSKELLTDALNFYGAAEIRSQDRKNYGKMLNQFSELIENGIANKDINALFALEKDAQEYDFANTQDAGKRRDSLSALKDLKEHWTRCQDKDYVVAKFEDAHSGIGMATSPINDPTMGNSIKSQCRKISSIVGANRTPAEALFYTKRQEALRFIDKSHNKMINQHLGLNKA